MRDGQALLQTFLLTRVKKKTEGKKGYRRDRHKLEGKMNAECCMGKQAEPTGDWGWQAVLPKQGT